MLVALILDTAASALGRLGRGVRWFTSFTGADSYIGLAWYVDLLMFDDFVA